MDEYEAWYVEENGPRPEVPRGTDERIRQLDAELHALRDLRERVRQWDQGYLAGREALRKFGRSDL